MNFHQWFWITWATAFFVVEMHAIIWRVPMGTLSEQLWFLRDHSRGWFSLSIALLIWSIYHFVFE